MPNGGFCFSLNCNFQKNTFCVTHLVECRSSLYYIKIFYGIFCLQKKKFRISIIKWHHLNLMSLICYLKKYRDFKTIASHWKSPPMKLEYIHRGDSFSYTLEKDISTSKDHHQAWKLVETYVNTVVHYNYYTIYYMAHQANYSPHM